MKKLVFASQLILFLALMFSSCSDDIETQETLEEEQPTLIHSSHDHRTCGNAEHMQELLSNPEYKKAYDKKVEKFKAYNKANPNLKANCTNPTQIPVAIHYQSVTNANLACLTSLAQESVQVLNDDFQGTNSDIAEWNNTASVAFPGINNGESCVQFIIADQNHPSGYGLTNGDLAITINATSGDSDNNWAGYLNLFVIPNTGFLGYAPLGGAGNGDGVVIDAGAFGSGTNCGSVGSSAPYNLGRTLTHEVGHYLFLDHIWGNGCGTDDGISDTPSQNSDYSGCPNIGQSSCGSTDLHMNYMDYTNDACMYMFTAGQSTVTTNYLNSNLGSITSNASSAISGGGGNGGNNSTCDAPGASNATVQSSIQATVTWTAVTLADSYLLQYRVIGTSSWTSRTSTQPQAIITGLTAATTYQYRIRTVCSFGNSTYSSIATFTTSAAGNQTCDVPASSNANVQSSTQATVTWPAVTLADSYLLQYRVSGTTSWTSLTSTQAQATVTGLTAATTYQYRIRTVCSFGNSSYTAVATFTTSAGGSGNTCDKPGYTEVENISATKTKVSWEAMSGAIRYNIRYRKLGSSWRSRTTTNTSRNLTNLTPGATYEYRVRTRCTSGWTSYTSIETFVQGGGSGGSNNGCNDNALTFELTLDQYGSETTWELIKDSNNQVISQGGPYNNNQSGTIKTTSLCIPDGCYTLYVDDSYGDGICCNYGNGSFELKDSNGATVGYSHGNFGYYDYIEFCVTNNVVTFRDQQKDAPSSNLARKAMNPGSNN